jgi:hypothetical protein
MALSCAKLLFEKILKNNVSEKINFEKTRIACAPNHNKNNKIGD